MQRMRRYIATMYAKGNPKGNHVKFTVWGQTITSAQNKIVAAHKKNYTLKSIELA